MYEDKTLNIIHEKMLGNIHDTYEKSVGYPTFDFTKSFSISVSELYKDLSKIADMVDIDKLTGDELTKYVWQRKGIRRKLATNAKGTVTVTGNGAIFAGNLFSTANGVQFKSLESKVMVNNGDVKVQAVIAGGIGNVGANTITQMPITLQGITKVTNTNVTYDGFEEETDEDLRSRYYEALQLPATSANIYHYMLWAKEVDGVGDVKVIPKADIKEITSYVSMLLTSIMAVGSFTQQELIDLINKIMVFALSVKVLIIDTNKLPASKELIERVQNYIDPKGIDNSIWGTGAGQAPIGCYCTVSSAKVKNINITVDIQEMQNFTLAEVKKNIEKNILKYLKSIAFKQSFVSYAKIGSIILDTEGVQDYTSFTVNDGNSNVTIDKEEVAVLGTVNVI